MCSGNQKQEAKRMLHAAREASTALFSQAVTLYPSPLCRSNPLVCLPSLISLLQVTLARYFPTPLSVDTLILLLMGSVRLFMPRLRCPPSPAPPIPPPTPPAPMSLPSPELVGSSTTDPCRVVALMPPTSSLTTTPMTLTLRSPVGQEVFLMIWTCMRHSGCGVTCGQGAAASQAEEGECIMGGGRAEGWGMRVR